jgi:DnaJ-class molecular chaperone
MSLTRRLGRLFRAHWGALRREETEGRFSPDDFAREAHDTPDRTEETPSEETVPPEVAAAYRALEVPVGSSRAEVKTSYRRLMKKYHQDRFENDPDRRATAGEVSKRLNRAYERVTDYLDEQKSGET